MVNVLRALKLAHRRSREEIERGFVEAFDADVFLVRKEKRSARIGNRRPRQVDASPAARQCQFDFGEINRLRGIGQRAERALEADGSVGKIFRQRFHHAGD